MFLIPYLAPPHPPPPPFLFLYQKREGSSFYGDTYCSPSFFFQLCSFHVSMLTLTSLMSQKNIPCFGNTNSTFVLVPVCFGFLSPKSMFWKKLNQLLRLVNSKRNFFIKVAFWALRKNWEKRGRDRKSVV